MFDCLFSSKECDVKTMHQLLSNGAAKVREKLHSYAGRQLPGGEYWDPDPNVKNELDKLKPTNDLYESILGLNDYLTTSLPNLHQASHSNLVQVKKNKTIQWLEGLTEPQQHQVIDLAVRSRQDVKISFKEEEDKRAGKRRENMEKAHAKHEAMKNKLKLEKEKLSKVQLVTTTEELDQALSNIDSQLTTASKRKGEKLKFLRNQVNLWKKVLEQNIHIPFSHSGRQRSVNDIVTDLKEYIQVNPFEHSSYVKDPSSLVVSKLVIGSSYQMVLVQDGTRGQYLTSMQVPRNTRSSMKKMNLITLISYMIY